jgi:hypothetical protein
MAADQPQKAFAGFRAFSRVCSLDLFQADSRPIRLERIGNDNAQKRAKTRENNHQRNRDQRL